jgi:hypothetical protein
VYSSTSGGEYCHRDIPPDVRINGACGFASVGLDCMLAGVRFGMDITGVFEQNIDGMVL